jgi:hypothetical protein
LEPQGSSENVGGWVGKIHTRAAIDPETQFPSGRDRIFVSSSSTNFACTEEFLDNALIVWQRQRLLFVILDLFSNFVLSLMKVTPCHYFSKQVIVYLPVFASSASKTVRPDTKLLLVSASDTHSQSFKMV